MSKNNLPPDCFHWYQLETHSQYRDLNSIDVWLARQS